MFENTFMLWFLFLTPVLVFIMIIDILKLRKKVQIIAGEKKSLIIPYYSEGQKWLKLFFFTLGFVFAILALARPRFGMETIEASVKGRDIMVLLDVSYSMATPDVIPNRMEMAKREINELLQLETGDRIGLMVFAGDSELLSPVTHDYAAISFFLDSVYPNMLPDEGTDIGKALMNAIDAFEDGEPRNKMLLLLTDGENLSGDYVSMLAKAKESQVKIFTVGIGSKNGEPIPIRNSKGEVESYVKDENGKHVISKLDEKRLIEIALTTGAAYLPTNGNNGEMKRFIDSISGIEKKAQDKVKYDQKKERYDIFLIPSLILFALGFILDQGRFYRFKTDKFKWLFNKNIMMIFCFLLVLPISGLNGQTSKPADLSTDVKKEKSNWIGDPNGGFFGNISFKKGDFKKSLEKYKSAENSLKGIDLGKLYYNIGNNYYKLNDYEKAIEYFKNADLFLKDDLSKSMNYYNLGLVYFKNKNYKDAKEMFKKALLLNQTDNDARYNYEVSKLLDELSKKQNDDKNNQNQNQKQKKENKSGLSKEEMEKLLKALDEKEKSENKTNAEQKQAERNNDNNRGKNW